jgi:pterin-4a-carbinolamine dehydratase|tara:strand:+ start:6147 stop:6596 length:450 start_codon:yes stop_codon:yes gene_type:complete
MKKLGKNSLSLIGLLDTKLTNVSDNSSDLPSGMGRILEGLSRFQSTIPQQLPIKPESADWDIHLSPERLVKVFEFETFKSLSFFVFHLLDYQEENQHHARITVDYRSVGIEAYTHNIDSVTELDKKLAKFCDELYEDVTHINKIKIDQE